MCATCNLQGIRMYVGDFFLPSAVQGRGSARRGGKEAGCRRVGGTGGEGGASGLAPASSDMSYLRRSWGGAHNRGWRHTGDRGGEVGSRNLWPVVCHSSSSFCPTMGGAGGLGSGCVERRRVGCSYCVGLKKALAFVSRMGRPDDEVGVLVPPMLLPGVKSLSPLRRGRGASGGGRAGAVVAPRRCVCTSLS